MPVKTKTSRSLFAAGDPRAEQGGRLEILKGGRCQPDELPVVIESIPRARQEIEPPNLDLSGDQGEAAP